LAENDTNERKVNPIVSKLAREHPENPVHLRGNLLGAPEPAQPPIKPPNPFAQNDELPKLPKIDWTIYERHRIDGKTRISHDDWARVINSTKDFGGIIPTMVRTIQEGGDKGRGNVADVIGRVAESNPDHARFFQRELSTALGGETIPARMARMMGEPMDSSEAPGLLGPSKPLQYLRAYPQQPDPRPEASRERQEGETQVAAGPAAVLAAPYVIEGAAAASTAAAAYWAAHPELHPAEPDWFKKLMGKNETSVADPEAAKPKIETFPADAGKPQPLGGYPSEPPRMPDKETLPARPPEKSDVIVHEQVPSKVEAPDILDMHKLPQPRHIPTDGIDEETRQMVDAVTDPKTRAAIYETMVKTGTITHAGKGQGTNIIAPPVPKGQENQAAKAAWEEGVRKAGGDPSRIAPIPENDKNTWVWNGPNGVTLKYRDGSSQGEPTYELERDNPGTKGKDRIKIRFVPK
jgi:hypothetical protein